MPLETQQQIARKQTRSEQQEWTVEIQDDAIALYIADDKKPILFDRLPGRVVLLRLVADAHNSALTAAYDKGHRDAAKVYKPARDEDRIALTAERQRYQDARNLWNVAEGEPHDDWIRQMQNCINDLKSERQRRETETDIVDSVWRALGITTFEQANGKTISELVTELRQQLLSALAAIARHNNRDDCGDTYAFHTIDVDLSLLHEHDAELLKEHGL
jgi:hypothetical protein